MDFNFTKLKKDKNLIEEKIEKIEAKKNLKEKKNNENLNKNKEKYTKNTNNNNFTIKNVKDKDKEKEEENKKIINSNSINEKKISKILKSSINEKIIKKRSNGNLIKINLFYFNLI
jgi:hypothetical protein